MNSIWVWFGIGGTTGLLSMLWLSYVPARYHRIGFWVALLAGGILARIEFELLPDWPGHSFEREIEYFFIPTVVAMGGVFGSVTLVARKRKWLWLGAVAGAALYSVLRVATWLAMLFYCCA